MENLAERIIYGTDINSVVKEDIADCCFHCICTGGSARFRFNEAQFEITANEMAVISYPMLLDEITAGNDFECEFIIAPTDFLHALLPANNYSLPGSISLSRNPLMAMTDDDMSRIHCDFKAIASRVKDTDHLFYREMIGSLLRTMVYDIFDIHARRDKITPQTARLGYVVARFISMIRDGEPRRHREPSWYASQLNITVKYLSDSVKRLTRTSVSNHINRAASAMIREYIDKTQLSLTQIAEEMNFNSLSYFNRYCRRHLGASPSTLRRLR